MKIVFFDEDCLVCNNFMNYLLRKDRNNILYFSSLNSKAFNIYCKEIKDIQFIDSIVYYQDGHIHIYSTAIAEIFRDLNHFLKLLILLPKPFREFLYRLIAKNRKKLKKNQTKDCKIVSNKFQNRILL